MSLQNAARVPYSLALLPSLGLAEDGAQLNAKRAVAHTDACAPNINAPERRLALTRRCPRRVARQIVARRQGFTAVNDEGAFISHREDINSRYVPDLPAYAVSNRGGSIHSISSPP